MIVNDYLEVSVRNTSEQVLNVPESEWRYWKGNPSKYLIEMESGLRFNSRLQDYEP